MFRLAEWAFLFSGGLTVAYMLKLFVCLFFEKNEHKQESYEEKTNYMSLLSKIVIGLAAVVLPIFGAVPGMTMDRLADGAMEFLRSGHLHHEVHYFTWVNLKGGMISIGIGVLVYFLIIRKIFIRNGNYVDLWPKKLDVEVIFTAFVKGFVKLLGKVSKIMDGILLEWLTVESILKVLNAVVKLPERLPEGVVGFLKKTVYKETTERPELELTNRLHAQYDRKVDTMRLIGSSLSFGLLLACIGLIMTIVYLMIN